jgi:hypothetical protein
LTGLLKDLSCESAFRSEKWNMLDHTLLHVVAEQLLAAPEGGIVIDGQKFDVKRVGSGRLRSVKFEAKGRELHALEQNPDKPSRWGRLAKDGHHVVQFRDVETNRYVAVSVDGEVKEYGRMGHE